MEQSLQNNPYQPDLTNKSPIVFRKILLPLILGVCCVSSSPADVITLHSGKTVEGEITRETPVFVRIETTERIRTQEFLVENIKSITRGDVADPVDNTALENVTVATPSPSATTPSQELPSDSVLTAENSPPEELPPPEESVAEALEPDVIPDAVAMNDVVVVRDTVPTLDNNPVEPEPVAVAERIVSETPTIAEPKQDILIETATLETIEPQPLPETRETLVDVQDTASPPANEDQTTEEIIPGEKNANAESVPSDEPVVSEDVVPESNPVVLSELALDVPPESETQDVTEPIVHKTLNDSVATKPSQSPPYIAILAGIILLLIMVVFAKKKKDPKKATTTEAPSEPAQASQSSPTQTVTQKPDVAVTPLQAQLNQLASQTKPKTTKHEHRSFWNLLPHAIIYAFRKDVLFAFVFLVLTFLLINLTMFVRALTTPLMILFFCYAIVLMLKLIHVAALNTNDTAFEWPNLGDIGNWIGQLFSFAFAATLLLGPAVLYFAKYSQSTDAIFVTLLAIGLLLMPMCVLVVTILGGASFLNPALILKSIARTSVPYLVTTILLVGFAGLNVYLSLTDLAFIPVWGKLVKWCVFVYSLFITTKLLGTFYRTHVQTLNWFPERKKDKDALVHKSDLY